VEHGHGLGQQRGAGARKARHPQLATFEARDRGQLALGLVETGDRRLGVAHEHPAGVGQFRPAPGAVQQLHPDFFLKRGDLLADCRLGEVERVGRCGERTLGRDLAEDPQPLHIEHKGTLSDVKAIAVALIRSPRDPDGITNSDRPPFHRQRSRDSEVTR
jgi:hypothetical protein